MKRTFPLLLIALLAVPLLMTACSSEPVREVYTAAGDGSRPEDLDKTTVFTPDEDLNIVVTLNSHNRELPVYAVFTAPDGNTYPTDPLELDETAGEAVLGLDWEANNNVPWTEGEWKVEIYVEDERKETITFTVQTPTGANNAG